MYHCIQNITEKEFFEVVDAFPDGNKKRFITFFKEVKGKAKYIAFLSHRRFLEAEYFMWSDFPPPNVQYYNNTKDLIAGIRLAKIKSKLSK